MPQKPINPALRQRFEALKELKAQYMVGSQTAHNYLKMQRFFENLCDQINRYPNIQRKLTVRETSDFYHILLGAADFLLTYLSLKFSTPENVSMESTHIVLSETGSLPEYIAYEHVHGWRLDCNLFCENFFEGAPSWFNPSKREELQIIILFFFTTVLRDLPCFIYLKTGERFSCREIEKNDNLRKGHKEGFWGGVEATLDQERLPIKIHSLLTRAYREENLALAHKIIKKLQLRRLTPARFLDHVTESSTEELTLLLDPRNLYERAEREYTLGTFMVERQIVLGIISKVFSRGMVPESIIDWCTERELKLREECRVRLAEQESLNAPKVIVENEKCLLRYRSYRYLALKKNRRWLIEFFSR